MYQRILHDELLRLKRHFKVVTVTGPRQSGKTTLCKMAFPDYRYVNLEDETVLNEMELDRKAFLERYGNALIIDEVQRMPEILSTVQVVVDANPQANIVLTGSNNLQLSQKVTQSLAGRTAILTLLPFSVAELTADQRALDDFEIMYRGFYPAIWANDLPATDMYRQYHNTYLQRDIQQVINIKRLAEFRKFLIITASRVGCEFNAGSISKKTLTLTSPVRGRYVKLVFPRTSASMNNVEQPALYALHVYGKAVDDGDGISQMKTGKLSVDNGVYDLSGRKVGRGNAYGFPKGLYIKSGRKVAVR